MTDDMVDRLLWYGRDSVSVEQSVLLDAAAEIVALRARLAEADEQIASLQTKVHLCTAYDLLESRLAEAEALLREAREPVWIISTLREASVLQSRDRDRLKSLVTRIDAFLGDKP